MLGNKGISPMIAIVLLIAFTVAVGGILSLWLTTLAGTQTTTTGTEAEKQTLCARTVLTVNEVYYTAGDKANVTYTYTYGTETLTNFNFFFVDTARNSYNKTEPGNTMSPGDRNTTTVDLSAGSATGTLERVRVVAMCQTDYPVSGECKSDQTCMKTA